jgi:hypothetical protein
MPSGEDGQRAEPLQRNDERVAVGVGTWEAKAKLASGSGHPSGDVEKGQAKAFAPTGMKPFGESEDPDPTGDHFAIGRNGRRGPANLALVDDGLSQDRVPAGST